jgi:hypothetical protein
MLQIILLLIGFCIFIGLLSVLVERWPKVSFFLYRFSGSLFFISLFLQALSMYEATGKKPGLVFLYIAMFFYLIWLIKITGIVLNSSSEEWWMLILKIWLGLSAVVFFPIGILAYMSHEWFVVKKIQENGT